MTSTNQLNANPPLGPLLSVYPEPMTNSATLSFISSPTTTSFQLTNDLMNFAQRSIDYEYIDTIPIPIDDTIVKWSVTPFQKDFDLTGVAPIRILNLLCSGYFDASVEFLFMCVKPLDSNAKLALSIIPDGSHFEDVATTMRATTKIWEIGKTPLCTIQITPPNILSHRATRLTNGLSSDFRFRTRLAIQNLSGYCVSELFPSRCDILVFMKHNNKYYHNLLPIFNTKSTLNL